MFEFNNSYMGVCILLSNDLHSPDKENIRIYYNLINSENKKVGGGSRNDVHVIREESDLAYLQPRPDEVSVVVYPDINSVSLKSNLKIRQIKESLGSNCDRIEKINLSSNSRNPTDVKEEIFYKIKDDMNICM